MSVQAISWVLDQSQSRLRARLVLLSIANHATSGGVSAPDSFAIACEARLNEREVQAAIRELEASGELSVQSCAGCSRYTLKKMQQPGVATQVKGGGG